MTLREEFVKSAMEGLIAGASPGHYDQLTHSVPAVLDLAVAAVYIADAVIKEMKETQK
jgi:hypothetical protein